jgi:carboxypeptidase T
MVDAIASVHRVRYENIKSSQLYVASGIVGDDFYESFKLDGYTIECRPGRFGGGGFAPPPAQILPTAQENYKAVLVIMEHVFQQ